LTRRESIGSHSKIDELLKDDYFAGRELKYKTFTPKTNFEKGKPSLMIKRPSKFNMEFEILEVIGSGSFGTVMKCRYKIDR